MIRVGLTGGIGAGKSTVARAFSQRGAHLIDADVIAREVVAPGSEGLAELVTEFGDDILDPDGALDRAALAARAFVDEDSRKRLNAITHPRVGARTWELIQAAPDDAIVVQDIPLLVEGGLAPMFHLVVIVWADEQTRLQRLTEQRGMPADDAAARIRAQADDDQRRAVADVWLDNSGAPEAVADAAARLWDERLVPFEANVRAGVAAVASGPPPAGPDADGLVRRVTNRLRAVAGERAQTVERETSDDGITLRVTVADEATASGLIDPLTEAGFPRVDGDGQVHGSADPGRPVTVRVVTAD
ncbi:MAG: dephospho-CoA kinase [Gordonia paraffinivorans]